MQQPLTAPDANNPHTLGITPVNDAEWRMDDLPPERLVEFGYHPAHIRMVSQGLDALKHFLRVAGRLYQQ